jgi:hypothetical protein
MRKQLFWVAALAATALVAASGGCGSKGNSNSFGSGLGAGSGDNGGGGSGGLGDDSGLFGDDATVNTGCPTPTTLTGKVYDPAGKNPLYHVAVFAPKNVGALPRIVPGTRTCNTCDVPIGDYWAAATTDETGSFTLQGVPTGNGVPLVLQIGKWRRIVPVNTKDCAVTAVPDKSLRLPHNRGEGDMPQMALLTGGLDDLGCFLRRVGIDSTEYSAPGAGGRLDIYQGVSSALGVSLGNGPGLSSGTAGNCTGAGCPLWASKQSLEAYDIVILACEGGENNQTKPASAMTAMHDWLGEGGKVFATHFHYTWFKNGPADFQGVANWLGTSAGIGMGNYQIDASFPKGKSFERWLDLVGGATGATIALNGVATSVSNVNAPTTRWIYDTKTNPNDTKYMSFGTPIGGLPGVDAGEGGKAYCGKAVFSDLHAGGSPSGDVPGACKTTDLSPQEKALEFLFFDLSACVQDDTQPVFTPPPR